MSQQSNNSPEEQAVMPLPQKNSSGVILPALAVFSAIVAMGSMAAVAYMLLRPSPLVPGNGSTTPTPTVTVTPSVTTGPKQQQVELKADVFPGHTSTFVFSYPEALTLTHSESKDGTYPVIKFSYKGSELSFNTKGVSDTIIYDSSLPNAVVDEANSRLLAGSDTQTETYYLAQSTTEPYYCKGHTNPCFMRAFVSPGWYRSDVTYKIQKADKTETLAIFDALLKHMQIKETYNLKYVGTYVPDEYFAETFGMVEGYQEFLSVSTSVPEGYENMDPAQYSTTYLIKREDLAAFLDPAKLTKDGVYHIEGSADILVESFPGVFKFYNIRSVTKE